MCLNNFRNEWITQIATHQNGLIPVDEVEKHKMWFQYIFNKEEPVKSTYRCRLCHKYYDEFNLDKRWKSPFSAEVGTLKKYKKDNKDAISDHGKSVGHQNIIQMLQDQSAKR